jgi:hypothetical protein
VDEVLGLHPRLLVRHADIIRPAELPLVDPDLDLSDGERSVFNAVDPEVELDFFNFFHIN